METNTLFSNSSNSDSAIHTTTTTTPSITPRKSFKDLATLAGLVHPKTQQQRPSLAHSSYSSYTTAEEGHAYASAPAGPGSHTMRSNRNQAYARPSIKSTTQLRYMQDDPSGMAQHDSLFNEDDATPFSHSDGQSSGASPTLLSPSDALFSGPIYKGTC